MSDNENFKNIIISFSIPKDIIDYYEFIKKPPSLNEGSLNNEVLLIQKNISLKSLMHKFFASSGFTTPLIGITGGLVVAAVLTIALDLVSLKSFPDEYGDVLDLIEETPRGFTLNIEKINSIISDDENIVNILKALENEKFIKIKRNGSYMVRKKILIRTNVNFIKDKKE